MKLLDANILLYAYDGNSAHHEACRFWLDTVFNSGEIVAFPWQPLLAFVRIATNPRAVRQPLFLVRRPAASSDLGSGARTRRWSNRESGSGRHSKRRDWTLKSAGRW